MSLDDIRTALYVSKFTFMDPNVNLGWEFGSTKVLYSVHTKH